MGGFGIVDNFFVSKAFCEQEGIEELYNSRCDISFEKRWMSEEEQQAFIDKMELENLSDCSMYTNSAMLQKYSGESQESWLLPV